MSHREIEGDGFLGDQRSNSSSSINSSSSRSSWADKVKGSNSALVLAATIEVHSVEDLLHRKKTSEAAPREGNTNYLQVTYILQLKLFYFMDRTSHV
jgi:hypothetical protein